MKRQKTDARVLIGTAVLVLVLGVQAVSDLLHDDDLSPMVAASNMVSQRKPASIPVASNFQPPKALSTREVLVSWDCKEKSLPSHVNVANLEFRLKADGCAKTVNQNLALENESNGFTASVFAIGKTGFETDLIQLVPGENHLHLKTSIGAKPAKDIQWTVFSSFNTAKSHD